MCGVFGMTSVEDGVIQEIILGTHDLQHRGEQACGVAVSDSRGNINCHHDEGLITEAFNARVRERLFEKLPGKSGIGHTLYSTVGKSGEKKQPRTFHPIKGDFHGQSFALAHNGNLIEFDGLREEAKKAGYQFKSESSDTEVIVALLSTSKETEFLEALKKTLPRLKGAFALVILYKDKVIGVRDNHGIRPLCLGHNDKSFILASESCAFYTLGATFIRSIQPGEVIVLGNGCIERSFRWAENCQLRLCVFEFVYFARPDSVLWGQSVCSHRTRAGRILAKEQPIGKDIIVVPVVDSGRIYDEAFAAELGLPVQQGLFRNRYFAGRTFLTPRDVDRRKLQRMKIHPLKDIVFGQKVCLIEDSLIRGSVCTEIVAMMREAGAAEVHLRVCSPPLRHPCFLGVDMPTKEELLAARLSVESIRDDIVHSDSLEYLSTEGLAEATGLPKENLCLGCFTGEYPIEPPKS
jgi:amidophosphoribosyltransferase